MKKTANLTNAIPPDSTNPNGRVKDESSLNQGDGTPVNDKSVGNIIVSLEQLVVESGQTVNDLDENTVNGFQIVDAVKLIPPPDNSVSQDKLQNNSVITDKIAPNAVTTDKIADQSVTDEKIDDNAKIITTKLAPSSLYADPYKVVKTKIIPIGVWDMSSTQTVTVPHGLLSDSGVGLIQIVDIRVTIIEDGFGTNNNVYTAPHSSDPGNPDIVGVAIVTTADISNVNIRRKNNSYFANNAFNQYTQTTLPNGSPQNRGFIVITWLDIVP